MNTQDLLAVAREHWPRLDWREEPEEGSPGDGALIASLGEALSITVELTTTRHGAQFLRAGVYVARRGRSYRVGHESPRRASHASTLRLVLDDLREGLEHTALGYERELEVTREAVIAIKGGA
jgi:hypothetical protein